MFHVKYAARSGLLDGLLAAVEGSQRRPGSVFILVRRRVLDGLVRMRSGRPVFHVKHAAGLRCSMASSPEVEISQRRQVRYSSRSDQGGLDSPSRGGRGHQMFRVKYAARSGVLDGLLAAVERSAAGLGLHPGATKGAMAPSRRGRDIRCSTGNTRGSGCAMASSPRSRDRSGGRARSSSGAINGCSMVSPREVGHQVSERPLQAAGVSRRTPRRASIDSRAKNSENSAAAILTGYPQGSSQGLPGVRQSAAMRRPPRQSHGTLYWRNRL